MIKIENIKLEPPCTYQGGKQRVAKEIVDYIYQTTPIYKDTKFFDLCCGSGAITIELLNRGFPKENITMCDISSWGTFWKAIGNGTYNLSKFLSYANAVPRDKNLVQSHITKLSKEKATIDEEYKYPLIQASSFGGKQIWREHNEWKNTSFRNYWQPTETSKRRSPVNPMMPSIEILTERITKIALYCKGVTCINDDIYSVLPLLPTENCIVYIDPPYKSTTKYGFTFDYNDLISKVFDVTLSPVFVSEKEPFSDEAVRLNFNGAKGGINGNKSGKNEEWLNVFR